MKAIDVINNIRTALLNTNKAGQDSVSIARIDEYLSLLEMDLDDTDIDIANLNNENARKIESARSASTAGELAVKTSMLINGGGAIALLAFIGNIWSPFISTEVVKCLTVSMLIFCSGIFFAAVSSGTTYLSRFFSGSGFDKRATVSNMFSIALVIISHFIFISGAYVAAASLSTNYGF